MEHTFYKNPWFLTLTGFILWASGYIMGDDIRIQEEEHAKNRPMASIVTSHQPHDIIVCEWQPARSGEPDL